VVYNPQSGSFWVSPFGRKVDTLGSLCLSVRLYVGPPFSPSVSHEKINGGYNFAISLYFSIKLLNDIAYDNTDRMMANYLGQGHISQFFPFLLTSLLF